MHRLSSSNSLAHGKQRVCVEDFAEFFAVIDNHEEEIERNRTVRRVDHGCPGAIRVYRIGPGVGGETGSGEPLTTTCSVPVRLPLPSKVEVVTPTNVAAGGRPGMLSRTP